MLPTEIEPTATAPTDELRDDVVISGISGRFPESESIEEFKKNLFDGVDMVTEDSRRWPPGIYGVPTRTGKLKNLQHFDASFFGVHAKQAEVMDPQARILLEVAYEAIVDAGVNPTDIRGSGTGVFVGSSGGDSDTYWTSHCREDVNGYAMLGCNKAMFANRLSYTFDFKGPSCNIDTGCSSGLHALQQAYVAIQTGQCDAALVGGSSLTLDPVRSLQFLRLGMLSPKGKCNCFDSTGDGFVRAEGIVVIFLQKSINAKRIYASILAAKSNIDGYKEQGITYPSGKMHTSLLREVYEESKIDPHEVTYVETHGTGTKVGDPEEVNAIANVFCENRKNPLLIGGVKSNMGHSESAAAVCALAKIVIAIEASMIPANLHFNSPNKDIPGLHDGRLKVVSKHEQFKAGLIGINSFGFGGANAHVILKPNTKLKIPYQKCSIPRIIRVSGRSQESVDYFLNEAVKNQDDSEFLALLDEIYSSNIPRHHYRGFILLGERLCGKVSETRDYKRPIWFMYSGMGYQWSGMTKELMRFDVFRESIKKSANALKCLGMNLEEILLNDDNCQFNNTVHSFVAITAMQVALTDLLLFLEIIPDRIIGHSIGEIACAYGDGTLTTEQAVLSAYAIGRAVLDTKRSPCLMASVELSLEEAKMRCPPKIEISCHNSRDNVTICGPPDVVRNFVNKLTAENICANVVETFECAFHSKYVNDVRPELRPLLDQIIPCPKPRTSRWLSTSVPESEWTKSFAKLCSGEYFVNNILSPVVFDEILQYVPKNAIVIEIAPNDLMSAVLQRCLDPKVTFVNFNVNFGKKEYATNLESFLLNIGKLYVAGTQPKLHKLYPTVNFPVGRGTPSIASMIKWDHSIEWKVPNFCERRFRPGEVTVEVDLKTEQYKFLTGHFIDGRVLYPATGYLTLVWRTFAGMWNDDYEQMPVLFENVNFHHPTIIPREGSVKFSVNILEESGDFELSEGGTVVVSGRISVPEDINKEKLTLPIPEVPIYEEALPLLPSDIYKQLKLAGYEYSGLFKGILEANNWGNIGKLEWKNNWVTYMDTMLQVLLVGNNKAGLYVPTGLQRLVIDPQGHLNQVNDISDGQGVPVHIYRNINVVQSGGIEFRGLHSRSAPRNHQVRCTPKLEKYEFVPYINKNYLSNDAEKSQQDALTVLMQIVAENHINAAKLNIAEMLLDKPIESILLIKIKNILEKEPTVLVDACIVGTKPADTALLHENDIHFLEKDVSVTHAELNSHLVVLTNVLNNTGKILVNACASLSPGGFVLVEEDNDMFDKEWLASNELTVVAMQACQTKTYALLRKPIAVPTEPILIRITDENFSWLEPLKAAMEKSEIDGVKIYAYAQGEKQNGFIGMVNCLLQEPGGENLRSFFIPDSNAPIFSINKYTDQLRKDLVHNVWNKGVWGCYRHLLLDTSEKSRLNEVKYTYADITTPGDLSSFRWIQQPLAYYQ